MKTSLAAGRRIYAWWATVQGDAAHMRLANDSLIFNPLLRAVLVPTTNWNTSADLITAMRDAFGAVAGRKLSRGTVFLAVAEKEANGSARRETAPASASS